MVKHVGQLMLVSLTVFCTSSTFAAIQTYFGEDLRNGAVLPLARYPNASAAEADFLSNLVGVGTETFEGFADGTKAALLLSFPVPARRRWRVEAERCLACHKGKPPPTVATVLPMTEDLRTILKLRRAVTAALSSHFPSRLRRLGSTELISVTLVAS